MTEQRYAPREDKSTVEHGGQQPDGERVTVFDPGATKMNRRTIGMLAAGLALTGALIGGGYAMGHRGGTEAPKPQPTAGAGVAPSEAVGEPTPSSTEVDTTHEVTVDTFKYVIDGKEYVGQDALKRGFGIPASEYPANQPEKIVQAWFDRVNKWQNIKPTSEQEKEFADYMSADSHGGIGAMNVDFINPGFTHALSGTPPEGANTAGMESPDEWFSQQGELVNQTDGRRHLANEERIEGDEEYWSGYKIKNIYDPGYTDNQVSVVVDAALTDNGDKNAIGRRRTADADGYQGITTEKINENVQYSLTFMVNKDTNTWDLVSVK